MPGPAAQHGMMGPPSGGGGQMLPPGSGDPATMHPQHMYRSPHYQQMQQQQSHQHAGTVCLIQCLHRQSKPCHVSVGLFVSLATLQIVKKVPRVLLYIDMVYYMVSVWGQ